MAYEIYTQFLHTLIIPPASTKLKGGYTGFTLSVWIIVTVVVGSCSFCASQEVLPYYYNGTSTVLLEDQLYHRKTNCCVGRSTVLLEIDCYWKIYCDAGRSKVLLENQLYWRQSTGLDVNYRSRKITARRWVHKYVGAECGASSFTWYLYQMCNTDVRPSVCPSVHRIVSALYLQEYSSDPFDICTSYQAISEGVSHVIWQIL